LHAYESFQEKLRQLLGKYAAKRAPWGALFDVLHMSHCGNFARSDWRFAMNPPPDC